jgi:phage-related protein
MVSGTKGLGQEAVRAAELAGEHPSPACGGERETEDKALVNPPGPVGPGETSSTYEPSREGLAEEPIVQQLVAQIPSPRILISIDKTLRVCHNWHIMSTDDAEHAKPLFWIGSSREDLREFPDEVCHMMGFALWQAQLGRKHRDAKALRGFGGAGVLEVVEDHDGNTFRAVYTVKFAGAVYVLHAFQKKSKKGNEAPRPEAEVSGRPPEGAGYVG